MKTAQQIIAAFNNCGTGSGGFKSGNKCAIGGGGKATKQEIQKLSLKVKTTRAALDKARKEWAKDYDNLKNMAKFDQAATASHEALTAYKAAKNPPKSTTGLPPSQKVKGTSYTVGQLDTTSKKAGQSLFGKAFVHRGVHAVQHKKLSGLNSESNYVSDYSFVFKPSTGKPSGDFSGKKLTKSMADRDGKIYIYSAEIDGLVIISTK